MQINLSCANSRAAIFAQSPAELGDGWSAQARLGKSQPNCGSAMPEGGILGKGLAVGFVPLFTFVNFSLL